MVQGDGATKALREVRFANSRLPGAPVAIARCASQATQSHWLLCCTRLLNFPTASLSASARRGLKIKKVSGRFISSIVSLDLRLVVQNDIQ
jgi:hypothetical protein